jgi:hypothetical protein
MRQESTLSLLVLAFGCGIIPTRYSGRRRKRDARDRRVDRDSGALPYRQRFLAEKERACEWKRKH